MISAVRELINLFRVSIYQPVCVYCGNVLVCHDERIICHSCRSKIRPFFYPVCRFCGKSIREESDICGDCCIIPPPYRKHLSYTRYEGIVKELIILFKFKGLDPLKTVFEDILVELFRIRIREHFDWIVPVPPDPGRKREINPNLMLSRRISGRLDIPLMANNLIKVKKTEPQVLLTQARRLRNLKGAFKLKKPDLLKDKKVLLMDDVYTTGTTIKRCTIPLKKAGADVVAITIARSV